MELYEQDFNIFHKKVKHHCEEIEKMCQAFPPSQKLFFQFYAELVDYISALRKEYTRYIVLVREKSRDNFDLELEFFDLFGTVDSDATMFRVRLFADSTKEDSRITRMNELKARIDAAVRDKSYSTRERVTLLFEFCPKDSFSSKEILELIGGGTMGSLYSVLRILKEHNWLTHCGNYQWHRTNPESRQACDIRKMKTKENYLCIIGKLQAGSYTKQQAKKEFGIAPLDIYRFRQRHPEVKFDYNGLFTDMRTCTRPARRHK